MTKKFTAVIVKKPDWYVGHGGEIQYMNNNIVNFWTFWYLRANEEKASLS